MCLAQGPQCSEAGEARTHGPSVSSQALNHYVPYRECWHYQLIKLRSEIVWHRFFAVLAFVCHFRSYISVRKLLVYASPNFSSRFYAFVIFWQALISWKNQEIEKYASRLRQFDTFETPSMNVYGNDNIFIIILGSGYSNWRDIHEGTLRSMAV